MLSKLVTIESVGGSKMSYQKLSYLGLFLTLACDPGQFTQSKQGVLPENERAPRKEHTIGNMFKGNVTDDIEGGMGAFADKGNKSAAKKVRATIYYITDEKDFSGPKTSTVYGSNGQVLAKVSAAFKSALTIQGSGILADGRTVNIASKGRYFVTPHKYGVGSIPDKALIPFRSLAVDISYWKRNGYNVKNGDKVYIKSTDGMKIPGSNQVHNGVWEISDRGSAIKGNRIDMFFGTMHWKKALPYLADRNNFVSDFAYHDEAQGIGNKNDSINLNFMMI